MKPTPAPLSDGEAYDRLHAALLALGKEDGESNRAYTALKAARRSLVLLQIGLVAAAEGGGDDMPVVTKAVD